MARVDAYCPCGLMFRRFGLAHPSLEPMLTAFFVLTFVLTWTTWFAAAALAPPDNTGFFGVRGPVFLLGVFAPAIVALALTARVEGRAGVTRLLARIGQWQVGARWYVFASGYFPATQLAVALIYRV